MLAHSTESKKDWESEKEKRNRKKVSFDSVWNIQQPPIFVSKVHISRHIIYDISGSVLFLFFKRLLPGSVESAFLRKRNWKGEQKQKIKVMKNPTTKNMIRLNSSERQKQNTQLRRCYKENTHTHTSYTLICHGVCAILHTYSLTKSAKPDTLYTEHLELLYGNGQTDT